MRRSFNVLLILLLLSIYSCKDAKHIESTEGKNYLTADIPSSFMEFYERFHNDQSFQMDHIIFPLAGHTQDSITMELVPLKWKKEQWIPHKPFNSHGGTFKRNFVNLDGIILEKINDTQGGNFSMERRFSFIDKKWHLIYYSEFRLKAE